MLFSLRLLRLSLNGYFRSGKVNLALLLLLFVFGCAACCGQGNGNDILYLVYKDTHECTAQTYLRYEADDGTWMNDISHLISMGTPNDGWFVFECRAHVACLLTSYQYYRCAIMRWPFHKWFAHDGISAACLFFFWGFARVHFLLAVMFFQCQFIARLWHALPNNMYRLQHLALCLGIPWATQCVCVRVVFFDRAYVIACRKLPFLLHLEMIRIPAERFDCHNILCFFFFIFSTALVALSNVGALPIRNLTTWTIYFLLPTFGWCL